MLNDIQVYRTSLKAPRRPVTSAAPLRSPEQPASQRRDALNARLQHLHRAIEQRRERERKEEKKIASLLCVCVSSSDPRQTPPSPLGASNIGKKRGLNRERFYHPARNQSDFFFFFKIFFFVNASPTLTLPLCLSIARSFFVVVWVYHRSLVWSCRKGAPPSCTA